jgi:hypothetical protein
MRMMISLSYLEKSKRSEKHYFQLILQKASPHVEKAIYSKDPKTRTI